MASKAKTNKTYNKILGFDISENNLVAIEILFTKDKVNITQGFHLNIGTLQDINHAASLISQNLKSMAIKTKDCAFGFSMNCFKLFPVPIPKSIPKEEIDSIILQEGNTDVDNENVSWLPLINTERQDSDNVARFDVLGISVQKSLVETTKILTKKCGLNLVSLTPSFLGLLPFMPEKTENNILSTLWVSQAQCEFVAWLGHEPIYEHMFLTHQLKDQLFQSINYVEAQLPGTKISSVYACGPYVKETNLGQTPYNVYYFTLPQYCYDAGQILRKIPLNELIVPLGITFTASNNSPYIIPNLLDSITPPTSTLKSIFKEAPKAALGGARGFKLPFLSGLGLDSQILKFVYASAIIFLLSILFNFFIQNNLMPSVQANQASFQNKLSLAQARLAKVVNFEKTYKVLNVKVDYLSKLIDNRTPWSKVLHEIGGMTPKGLWIDRLEIRNNNIDVFGRALSVDSVANFSINLNYNANLVGKAQIIALKRFQEEGIDLIEFQVSARVKESASKIDNDVSDLASNKSSRT